MVKDEPGYAQDYYDYLTEERELLGIDEQNNNDVPHVSPSNSNLDICTLDDKEDNCILLGRLETTTLGASIDEKTRLQHNFGSSYEKSCYDISVT